MSLLSRLFGKTQAKEPDPESYKEFLIFPSPVKEASGYRIGARIEKEIDGEIKTHQMIRADTYGSVDVAIEASITKSRQMIDQMGDRIF